MDRDEWAVVRKELYELNAETISTIDSAIMVLCLDDDEPHQMTDFIETLLHNNDGLKKKRKRENINDCVYFNFRSNRWFDKNNLVVCANGKAGVTMEHSVIDGHTMLGYLDYMFKYAQERAHEAIPKGYYTPRFFFRG